MAKQIKRPVVGLTGGIGSGKSAATAYFQTLHIDVIDADIIAHEIVRPPSAALDAIAQHYGAHILLSDGCLDRKQLRDIIFADHTQKQWLEHLLHPLINLEIKQHISESRSPYCILVSPLLFETQQYQLCDTSVLITATHQTKIDRLIRRDQTTPSKIKAIINQQASDDEKRLKAEHHISNDSTLAQLQTACLALHHTLLKEYALND